MSNAVKRAFSTLASSNALYLWQLRHSLRNVVRVAFANFIPHK